MLDKNTSFTVPWSLSLAIITLIATALCFIAGYSAILHAENTTLLITGTLPLFMPFIAFMFIVRKYEMTKDNLIVYRLFSKNIIPLENIEFIERPTDIKAGLTRTMGNGGFFSYSGYYRNKNLRSFRALLNNWENIIAVKTRTGWFVLSPGNIDTFEKNLNELITQ